MTPTHIHLVLNHVPLIGTVIGLALLAYALLRKEHAVAKSAMSIFIFTALVAGVVYLTGESAEEAVEHLPTVTHASIETHEEAALIGLIATFILGLVSFFGLIVSWQKPLRRGVGSTVLVLAVATAGILTWVGFLGGKINHPELRTVTAQATEQVDQTENGEAPATREENDDDD